MMFVNLTDKANPNLSLWAFDFIKKAYADSSSKEATFMVEVCNGNRPETVFNSYEEMYSKYRDFLDEREKPSVGDIYENKADKRRIVVTGVCNGVICVLTSTGAVYETRLDVIRNHYDKLWNTHTVDKLLKEMVEG
jgi:hypothetical protein